MAVSVTLVPDKPTHAKGEAMSWTFIINGAADEVITQSGTITIDGVDYTGGGTYTRKHVVGAGTVPGFTQDTSNPLKFNGTA